MKTKILFILHLPPPVHGASMMGFYIQKSKILNETFEADFINLSSSTDLIQLGKGGINKYIKIINLQLNILKALFKKQYELVYITPSAKGAGFYKDFLIIILLKLFKKKIIYHFHNKGVKAKQEETIDNLLYKFAFRNTKTILLSPYLYFDIEKYVKKDDVYYCSNAIPRFDINLSNEIKTIEEPCQLLFLSNMMKEKGVYVLLEACTILKDKKLNFQCHFVGAWADIAETEFKNKIENYHLSSLVFAHGKKYNDDKYRFFNNADIFVFPTYNEAFGLVNLEAMQFGLPVISTPEGGIRDIVIEGETGFLVPPKDIKTLAEKLELLINDPVLRLKMGIAGKNRFESHFTLEIFEAKFLSILLDVLEHNKLKAQF